MTKVFVRWCRGMDMVVCVAIDINTDNDIIHQQMPPGNLADSLNVAICELRTDVREKDF